MHKFVPESARGGVLSEVDEHGHEAASEELQALRVPRKLLDGGELLGLLGADAGLEVGVGLGEEVAHRVLRTLLERELVYAPNGHELVKRALRNQEAQIKKQKSPLAHKNAAFTTTDQYEYLTSTSTQYENGVRYIQIPADILYS